MVNLHIRVITALIFCVMPFNEKSTQAQMRLNNINATKRKAFDFRDIVVENSVYSPFMDKCPLRIYGGVPAVITDIPYQVVIRKGTRRGDRWSLMCGGTIVTRHYVLTAAHCFPLRAIAILHMFRVVAGTSQSNFILYQKPAKLDLPEHLLGDEVWRKILNCYRHAYYGTRYLNHDLAVLELHQPISYTRTVQPIPMLRKSLGIKLEEKTLSMVSGYGFMEYSNPSPGLRMVCVPIVSNSKCGQYYGRPYVTSDQLCAGDAGKDSCQGDSGGPLTYRGYLAGIVSFGGRCGQAPGVYTLVSSYTTGRDIPFIKNHCIRISFNVFGLTLVVLILSV